MNRRIAWSAALAAGLFALDGTAHAHVSNIEITRTGSADNGNFHRYGWIDGTNATLGDSHHVAEGNFFVFHLSQPSLVTITFSEISGNQGAVVTNGGLDPAFTLYSGLLPDLAHDDTPYDPLTGNTVDLRPAGQSYAAHDGFRDTAKYSATGGKPYKGQFDALGSGGPDAGFSMANEDADAGNPDTLPGNWAKIKYLTHVNEHVTALGANLMPAGAVDDTPETLSNYPLPPGDYTIAASGASCDNLDTQTPAGRACVGPSLWGRVTFSAFPNLPPSFVGGVTALAIPQNIAKADLKPNLRVSDTDPGQTEAWSQASAPSHGKLSFSGAVAASGSANITPGGTITYTPVAGYAGPDQFSVQASDGLAQAIRNFTVTVKPNTPPTFLKSATGLKIAANSAANLKPLLNVKDPDHGQTESWKQLVAPAHGSLKFGNAKADSGAANIAPGGTIAYTPAAGYAGPDSFTIQVSDGMTSANQAFTVTVGANTAPAFASGPISLDLAKNSKAVNLKPNLLVNDADAGQTETWTLSAKPANGAVKLANATANSGGANLAPGGTATYQPKANWTGTDSFKVQVSDGIATAIQTFTVTVK